MKKSKKTNHFSRNLIIATLILTALVLPLAFNAAKNPVHYTPKAYIQEDVKALNNEPNQAPSLNGSAFTAIKCPLSKPCQHTFVGTDPNLYDTLSLTVDFLPPDLTLGSCQTSQNLIGNKKISCNLTGIANRQGTYKILATLTDGTNPPVTKTFTLNVD
jgi:hypothetical protein